MLRLLPLLVSLWAITTVHKAFAQAIYTPTRCSAAALTSSYLSSSPKLSASITQSFYLTSMYNTLTVSSSLLQPFNHSAILIPSSVEFSTVPSASPCFTASINSVTYTLSPVYAYDIDVQGQYAVVGAPNRDVAVTASFIDVLQISVNASNDFVISSQTIYADDSSYLGACLSLSTDQRYLAAFHSIDDFIVYSPVWNRTQDTYNTGGDQDIKITFPLSFYADNLVISDDGSMVAVSGSQPSNSYTIPVALIYVAQYSSSTVTAWNLVHTLMLTRVNPAESLINSLPLFSLSLPSKTYPMSFIDSLLAIGVPSMSTLFFANLSQAVPTPTYLTSTSDTLTSFPRHVQWSTHAYRLFVVVNEGLVIFDSNVILNQTVYALSEELNEVDLLSFEDEIIPNRYQVSALGASSFFGAGYTPSCTFLLSDSGVQVVPTVSGPIQFDFKNNEFEACPAGRYRNSSTIVSARSACALCPAGTYQNTTGSTSCIECSEDDYCPSGSVMPYSMEFINEVKETSYQEFESDDLAKSFEDLLVNGIFTPTTPPMITAFIVAGVTAILVFFYIFSTRLRPYVIKLLAVYRYVQVPTEEEANESQKEMQEQIDAALKERNTTHHHHKSSGEHGDSLDHHKAHMSESARDEGVANTELELINEQTAAKKREATKEVDDISAMEEHTMKGFFNVLLILFSLSSVFFSLIYLNNYQPFQPGDHEDNNRFRQEELYSVTVTDPLLLEGYNAINAVNATIYAHLVGYSGIECVNDALLGLELDGCIIIQSNLPCNESDYISVYENEEMPGTCTIRFNLIQGTLLANAASLSYRLPASLQVAALRLEFLQDAQNTDPINRIGTGSTDFWETVTHPVDANNNVIDNALASYVQRDWIFGILMQTVQYDELEPADFTSVWYNTVTSADTPYLPNAPLSDYDQDQSTETTIVLNMITETNFRMQKVVKLIQLKALFLTIVLGLIAISHIVEFGKQAFELLLLVVKRIRKNRALLQISHAGAAKLNQVAALSVQAINEVKQQTRQIAHNNSGNLFSHASNPGAPADIQDNGYIRSSPHGSFYDGRVNEKTQQHSTGGSMITPTVPAPNQHMYSHVATHSSNHPQPFHQPVSNSSDPFEI